MNTISYTHRRRLAGIGETETYHVAHECERAAGYFIGGDAVSTMDGYRYRPDGGYSHVEFWLVNERGVRMKGISVGWPSISDLVGERPPELKPLHDQVVGEGPEYARAVAELYLLAADFADVLTKAYEPVFKAKRKEIEQRAKEREEARLRREEENRRWYEEREKERARRQEWIDELVEALQWYIDQPMRLKRHGHKSTVMGRVNNITKSGRMHVITERNADLSTAVDALEHFEIKYEGDRTYTQIDLPEPPEGMALRRA